MLTLTHKQTKFGVGDKVRVVQKIKEGEKTRTQIFEGIVIGIKGRESNKSFTVRRIGTGQIGIERIFPLASPTIEKIEVVRKGTEGVKHSKLYYIRGKSKREIEKIFSRAARRSGVQEKTSRRKKAKKSSKKMNVK